MKLSELWIAQILVCVTVIVLELLEIISFEIFIASMIFVAFISLVTPTERNS